MPAAPEDEDLNLNRKIIDILDRVLTKGDWESTQFLKTSGKRLQAMRDEAQVLLASALEAPADAGAQQQTDLMPVYITLYQADAGNLDKWASLLQGLSTHSVSRPIYRQEDHVIANLKSKFDASKEGYVVVFVKEKDIIKPYAGRVVNDRLGHELLTLAQGAVHLTNIAECVVGDKRYTFDGEQLREQR